MFSRFPNPKRHYIPLNSQKPLPQTCLFQEAAPLNLSGVLVTLYSQEQGQHELYFKQKQLKPIAITGIPPTWMVISSTWKSPWWWTTPSWLWSRERREYSVCSSILPCRSSWVSIPLSPLSSKVRIFRKREKNLYSSQDNPNAPKPLSHFRYSHVFNSWCNCSDVCILELTSVQNTQQELGQHRKAAQVAFCNYPRWFFPPDPPPFQAQQSRSEGSRRAAQQPQRPRLRANLNTRSAPGRTALPREVPAAISDSTPVQPTPHAAASASVTRAEVKEPWRSGSPAVHLPWADRSHLSHPFLPNTEQCLAQGSYLNVDLAAQSKNRLVFV